MHGPGTLYSPWYSTIPTIKVRDGIAASLGFRKRRRWRDSRNRALALWEPAGVRFSVVEMPAMTWDGGPTRPDYSPAGAFPSDMVGPFLTPDCITMVRATYYPDPGEWWPAAWALPYSGLTGSLIWMNLERLDSSRKLELAAGATPTYRWDRTLCHEIGHCLGLTHGSSGVMGGSENGMVPSDHDIESVHGYYF